MRCPVCSSRLVEVKSKSTLVDVCTKCKGIWFDEGELVDFVRTLTESEEISPQTPQLFKEGKVKTVDTVKGKNKICPRCCQKLQTFNYAYDSNVFLDKCPQCQGIWADGGEVKEIARYLKEDPRLTAIAKGLIKKDYIFDDLAELGKTLMETRFGFLFIPKIIVPLSDDNPKQRIPIITLFIIILNTLIFIGEILFIKNQENFLQRFGFIPANFFSIGLISSMFLHVGLLHLIVNMLFFWLFGDNVEDRFSRLGFLIFYLSCGLAASILYSTLHWDISIPAIGASGAISGILGAYFVFYPAARVNLFFVYKILPVPAFVYLGIWFFFQLIYGFVFKTAGVTEVAWFAHIGGFIFGGLIAYIKKKEILRNWISIEKTI